jgi:hypothetical protein
MAKEWRIRQRTSFDDTRIIEGPSTEGELVDVIEKSAHDEELYKLKNDLDYVLGLGSTFPSSLLGQMSPIDFARKMGGADGLREVVGLELRCYGEARSAIAKLSVEHFEERRKLKSDMEAKAQILVDALEYLVAGGLDMRVVENALIQFKGNYHAE